MGSIHDCHHPRHQSSFLHDCATSLVFNTLRRQDQQIEDGMTSWPSPAAPCPYRKIGRGPREGTMRPRPYPSHLLGTPSPHRPSLARSSRNRIAHKAAGRVQYERGSMPLQLDSVPHRPFCAGCALGRPGPNPLIIRAGMMLCCRFLNNGGLRALIVNSEHFKQDICYSCLLPNYSSSRFYPRPTLASQVACASLGLRASPMNTGQ